MESDGRGGWNVTVVGWARTNAPPVLPFINYAFALHVAADGTVTRRAGGSHDGFPSYEIYSYDQNGRATQVYFHDEGWLGELYGISDVKVPASQPGGCGGGAAGGTAPSGGGTP